MNHVKFAEQATKKWYRLLRNGIPEIGTEDFASFAGHSSAFMAEINPSAAIDYSFIIDTDSDSAYIDQPCKTIAIPGWYFDAEAILKLNENVTDATATAVTLINGSMTHEALHSTFTPKTLEELISTIGSHLESRLYEDYGNCVNQVANIFEDLFIESGPLTKVCPYYRFFVDGKNSIVFPENEFEETKQAFLDAPTLANAILLAVSFKNRQYRDDPIYKKLPEAAQNALSEIIKLRHNSPARNRADLIHKFCRAFPRLTDEEKKAAKNGTSGKGLKLTSYTKIDGDFGNPKLPTSGMAEKSEKVSLGEIQAFRNSAESEVIEKSGQLHKDERGEISKPKLFDVENYPSKEHYAHTLSLTCNYSFIQSIMRLRTKNHNHGEALNKGSRLVNTRIYRIATDGKMFSRQNMEQKVERPVEIISLVDASGSMGSLFFTVLSAAKDIHMACRKLNISNAVYAHTSYLNRFEIPSLIHISSYNMRRSNGNVDAKFAEATKITLHENYDGYMIEEVTRAFTQRDSRKVLIVLSDGQPSGPFYREEPAIEHTRKMIAAARKAGIIVLCMSLVNHVVTLNDDIYGKKSNINATKDVKAEFERVIENLNKE